MNMYQVIMKISIMSLVLLNNASLLSMEQSKSIISTEIVKQRDTVKFIKHPSMMTHKKDVDSIMLAAAWSNDVEKERALKLRCDIKGIDKDNVKFIKYPSFTSKKEMRSIMLSAVWFNDVEKEKALKLDYDIKSISFVTTYKANSNQPNSFFIMPLDLIKGLRDKYNNNNIDQSISSDEFLDELEPALYCAVRSNDVEAIKNIGSKTQRYSIIYSELKKNEKNTGLLRYYSTIYSELGRNEKNTCLLMSTIERDHMVTFEAVVNADPFLVGSNNGFIEALSNADYISQDLKDKYSCAYKQCKENEYKFDFFNYSKGPYSYF